MRERLRQLLRRWSFREGEFVLASGATSRFYVDVRRTALTGEGAALIGDLLLDLAHDSGWAGEMQGVGGMTLGADPLTTAVGLAAHARGVSIGQFLVRKEAKAHGAGGQLVLGAELAEGSRVVLLEDTVTTGGSTLRAVEAVRGAGFVVVGALCVVDREEGGASCLAEAGVELRSIFTVEELRR
ncbi:MAG: orotate phosphoribosyltransferase [Deltaproteobacteria bacterium]|nr:MAG: orotate phosphoribosyltransferase [Deltaproteobacteria bacterium]